MTLTVDIVCAEGAIFRGEADVAILPAEMGELAVYPQHAPTLTSLKPGQVRLQREGEEEESFFVSGGIMEIQPDRVSVLADTALRADDIDEAAAEESRQRAERAMEQATEQVDYAQAQSELIEALARLKTAKKLRGYRG